MLSYDIEDRVFARLGKTGWHIGFVLFHRCGSRKTGHWPVSGNLHRFLWTQRHTGTSTRYQCMICHEVFRTQSNFSSKTFKNYARLGREADMKELDRMYVRASNNEERIAIKRSRYQITHESKESRDMRENLIEATRNQDHAEIKGIHTEIDGKRKYTNSI